MTNPEHIDAARRSFQADTKLAELVRLIWPDGIPTSDPVELRSTLAWLHETRQRLGGGG